MKRKVYTDGNGGSSVLIEGLGAYVPKVELEALKAQVEELREFALSVNRKCADYIMDGKRIDFETLGVAAYDSYRATPAQCLAEIRAQAVINFADMIRGAYLSGFVPSDLNVYDVYQSARNHVKDNYKINIPAWDDEVANQLRQQAKGGE